MIISLIVVQIFLTVTSNNVLSSCYCDHTSPSMLTSSHQDLVTLPKTASRKSYFRELERVRRQQLRPFYTQHTPLPSKGLFRICMIYIVSLSNINELTFVDDNELTFVVITTRTLTYNLLPRARTRMISWTSVLPLTHTSKTISCWDLVHICTQTRYPTLVNHGDWVINHDVFKHTNFVILLFWLLSINLIPKF